MEGRVYDFNNEEKVIIYGWNLWAQYTSLGKI